MTFTDVLKECASNRELVEQFDRLMGSNLSFRGSGLDLAIDEAAGRQKAEFSAFAAFVYEVIWLRLGTGQKP